MVASFRRHGSEGVTANGWVNGCVRSAVALCILAGLLLPTLPSQAAATSGWGLAIEIDTDNPGNASGSQVAVDGSGNAVAVWVQSDGAQYNIWANRYVVGSGWGTATLIETDDAGIAGGPQVAADGSRNAFAVWQQSNGTRVNIWANRYVAGSGWGTATLIETDNGGDASNPQVSVDGSGNAFAVWQQSSGARDNIWANRFVVGSGWGTATLIETDNAGRARFPQVAADASGNAVAVWEQFDGALDNIWANRFVVGSGWGTATLIETADASYATNPQVAVDGSGNAVAVWNQFDGTPYNIWANRFVVGSGWGIATLIETDDTGDAGGYQVAADASGNVVAVWTQFDGTRFNILASRYVVGLGWGTATFIETDNAGDASGSQIAVDASGNVVALWHQSDGIGYNIWANRYVVGSGWGTATLIETGDAGQAFFPQVAVDASGNAFAVWFQSDGIQYNIWANQFVPPDVTPPALLLVEPLGGTVTNRSAILVSGWTEPDASVSVRGIQAAVNSTGYFSVLVALAPGVNSIPVSARDAFGNSASASVNVMFEDPVPPLEDQFAAAQANASATAASLAASQLQLVAAQANLTAAQARVSTLEASAAATQAALAAAQARESALEANATAAKADLASAQSRITALETNGSADQTGAASGQAGLAMLLAVVGIAVGAVGCALALRSRRLAAVVVEPASPPASPPKQP